MRDEWPLANDARGKGYTPGVFCKSAEAIENKRDELTQRAEERAKSAQNDKKESVLGVQRLQLAVRGESTVDGLSWARVCLNAEDAESTEAGDRGMGIPLFSVSADFKGVRRAASVSAESKRLEVALESADPRGPRKC